MMVLLIIHLIALVFLLLCSGFFSSAEVAYFSINPLRVRQLNEEHPDAAQRITRALASPTRLLSTILIGNTLVNVCTSVIGFSFVKTLGIPHAEEITIPVITLLLLIFGEIGPKRLAIHRNVWMAAWYTPVILILMRITTPLRIILEQTSSSLQHLFTPRGKALTEEEFGTLVDLSHEAGILDEDESDMVKAIMKLEDLKASDIMTPRVDIIGVDLSESSTDNDAVIRKNRIRRMVLYRDRLDNIEGILDVRRYLLDPARSLTSAWISPYFVPEAARLNTILEHFQSSGIRIAIVVDEYGGTAGLLTRGDILEEIAGDFGTESGDRKLLIEQISQYHWLVDGQTSLEDLNEELALKLDAEGIDRLAGWISVQAEHLPRLGEIVEAQGCRAIVRQMRKHRITLVELRRLEEE